MDIWEIIVVAIRRWRIVVPTFVIGALLLAVVTVSAPPNWKAQAIVGFVGLSGTVALVEEEAISVDNQNPFVGQDTDSISTYAERSVVAKNTRDEVASRGLADTYEVLGDPFSPELTISVEGADPDLVIDTAAFLVEFVESEVERFQDEAEVNEELRVNTIVITIDDAATKDTSSTLKLLILGTGVLIILALGVGVIADVLAARRGQAVARDDVTAMAGFAPAIDRVQSAEWSDVGNVLTEDVEPTRQPATTSRWSRS